MSEGSLPPLRNTRSGSLLRTLRSPRLKEALRRLYARARGWRDAGTARASALESRATRAVREYLDVHAASLERALRLEKKAERLEKAGIPSESARNRAERAREEVAAGLAALRASFVEFAGGRDGGRAFDKVTEVLCPAFMPRRPSAGST